MNEITSPIRNPVEHFDFIDNPQHRNVIFSLSGEEVKHLQKCNEKVYQIYRYEELLCMLMNSLIAFNAVVYKYADYNRINFFGNPNIFEKTREVNQAALNYLSVLQMYHDFVNSIVKQDAIIDALFNSLEFQQCKVLRNYIQHVSSLPIIFDNQSLLGDQNTMLYTVRFFIPKKDIKVSLLHTSTKKIFCNIFGTVDNIDLYQIIQQSTDAVWSIQKQLRKLVDSEYQVATEFIKKIYELWKRNRCISCLHYVGEKSTHEKIPVIGYSTIEEIQKIRTQYPCNAKISNKYTVNAPEEYVKKCQKATLTPEAWAEIWKKEKKE